MPNPVDLLLDSTSLIVLALYAALILRGALAARRERVAVPWFRLLRHGHIAAKAMPGHRGMTRAAHARQTRDDPSHARPR
jgi:hypothetical protein